MFKKRNKKENIEVTFEEEGSHKNAESKIDENDNEKESIQASTLLAQSRAIKKHKNKIEVEANSHQRGSEIVTKTSKSGLEDITGLIDKKYLKETFDEEQEGSNNYKQKVKTNMIKTIQEDLNLNDDEDEEEAVYKKITDIQKDKAIEIENLIKQQTEISSNQERFQFKIPTKPTYNTAAPGFSEVRFSYDQKAKSIQQIEDARMKKLFGCDIFASDFEKQTQTKMSKDALKEKQEREFRQFEDKFLKRGRTYKINQMKANEYSSFIDSLH